MICEVCGKEFSEDWRKDRGSRLKPCRFCSNSCSHSRKHTTETIEKIKTSLKKNEPRFCIYCGLEISSRNRNKICFSCIKERKKTEYEYIHSWRKRLKQKLVETKGGKCQICGYNKCLEALDFHHLENYSKEFNISSNIRSIDKCLEEIKKCILVCSNCHREIHSGIITAEQWEVIPSV